MRKKTLNSPKGFYMRLFMFFINSIFWLWLFILPAGILGFISFWLYGKTSENLPISIIIALIGVVLGISLAEYMRKRYGLDHFFGRLLATPDIDGGNILDDSHQPGETEEIHSSNNS